MKKNNLYWMMFMTSLLVVGCTDDSASIVPSSEEKLTYTITFHQSEGDVSHSMEVIIGETFPEEVENFRDNIELNLREGYDTVWEEYDFYAITSDYTVEALYLLHQYKATFYRYADDNAPIIHFFDIENPTVVTPAVEALPARGHRFEWFDEENSANHFLPESTITYTGKLNDKVYYRRLTENTYRVNYLVEDGVCSEEAGFAMILYDFPYVLPSAIPDNDNYSFEGWLDEEGNKVPLEGEKWPYQEEISLTAKFSLNISFEGNVIPSTFSATGQPSGTEMEIISTEATDGGYCLKVPVHGPYTIDIISGYFDEVFSDADIVAINFDAKGSAHSSNFRSRHYEKEYPSGPSNWTYENNHTDWGLDTMWKTFEFKREYTEQLEHFIIGDGISNGYVLIDNIRAVFKHLDGFSFECGVFRGNSYQDGGHANANPAPKTLLGVMSDSDVTIQTSLTDTLSSDGIRSLRINKMTNGRMHMTIGTQGVEALGDGGYMTADIYTTIDINASPNIVANIMTGLGRYPQDAIGPENYVHPKNTWVTYTFYYHYYTDSTTSNSHITNDGRFIIIAGSTICDIYIDNIVFHPIGA